MSARSDLIQIYAEHNTSVAMSTRQYEKLKELHGQELQFSELRERIEAIKIDIEERIETHTCSRAQLREAIRILREYRRHENRLQLFYELVVAMFAGKWGPARMEYLQKALAAVRLPRDYFLSFTTRHTVQGGIAPVNQRYWYFIRKIMEDALKNKDRNKENLFAAAIHQIFSQKANGYFFPKSEDDLFGRRRTSEGIEPMHGLCSDHTDRNFRYPAFRWHE
jgi:hypothetical protein